jgi:hypothetical protein
MRAVPRARSNDREAMLGEASDRRRDAHVVADQTIEE